MVKHPVVGRLVYNPERDSHDFIPVEKENKSLVIRKTVQFKYVTMNNGGNLETILDVYNVTSWSME